MRKFVDFLEKNVVVFIILFFISFTTIGFLPPVLLKIGLNKPANIIYKAYSFFCHQLPERSLFLFGDKLSYSKEELKVEGYTKVFDVDLDEVLNNGKQFVGNEKIGYKIAFCARDLGMYISIIFTMLLITFTQIDFKRMPFIGKFLFVIPMILDGSIQFVSTVIYYSGVAENLFYESTNLTRVLTGALFGFGFVSMFFPMIKEEFPLTKRFDNLH